VQSGPYAHLANLVIRLQESYRLRTRLQGYNLSNLRLEVQADGYGKCYGLGCG
jgi:hypothetical protein